MNTITILFFATLRDYADCKKLELDAPDGIDVRALKNLLVERIPALEKAMQTVLVSINREYAFDEDMIPEHAEVALFPPVSGG